MSDNLWKYLKEGLNYLETEAAIEDVINRCKGLSQFNMAEVLSDSKIYESFAKAYADILLRHYLQVIPSRQQQAHEYKIRVNTNLIL